MDCEVFVIQKAQKKMETSVFSKRSPENILTILKQNRQRLKQFRVRKIGLFGSYSRGTPQKESDMDFLVHLDNPSFDDYMDLKFFLEDLFNCKVDLVMEETLKPRLRPTILNEVIYAEGL